LNWRLAREVSIRAGRITAEDASRQMRTAKEILRRFDHQPGVILADEVGMGKTFVALAVAASVVQATGGERPVVVMVPPSVQEKWPREWDVFRQTCLRGVSTIRASSTAITRPAPFFQLLDDPPNRRKHLIFLTHGALTNAMSDPYTRLAIIRRAFGKKRLARERRAFPRWADRILPGAPAFRREALVTALLDSNPRNWRAVLRRAGYDPGDDPVPDAVLRALPRVDLSPIVEALGHLPLRTGIYVEERLRTTRQAVTASLTEVWRDCMSEAQLDLPLLILDEAHHLKNPWTRFASLFASPQAADDADLLRGPFGGVFDRMLFLTATPFQLGHHELTEVLRRFTAVRWGDGIERAGYEDQIAGVELALTAAQTAALRLDRAWGRLSHQDLADLDGEEWWGNPPGADASEDLASIVGRISETHERMREAEKLLRPLVIRHVRPDRDGRRQVLPGRNVVPGVVGDARGLEVGGPAVLPFLLAARVQALVARDASGGDVRSRAYFAEGLASSFEAYRDTRSRQAAAGSLDGDGGAEDASVSAEAAWYLRHLDDALPANREPALRQHPKIGPTVKRVLELWKSGEKVVVFCFYIATGRALRAHVSSAIQEELIVTGARKLGLPPSQRRVVMAELDRLADRFFDPDSPVTRAASQLVGDFFTARNLSRLDREQGVEVVLRFLRTPSFLVRHVDLASGNLVSALDNAFSTTDASGRSLKEKIACFADFVADRVPEERAELLAALSRIHTGTILAAGDSVLEGETPSRRPIVPNVRLANGETERAARRRLMLAFNTPFFPEVLISSSVMAEGVDLQIDCRYVIHHDLDWNPSVLEQRTGRLDRLGSKAEITAKPIVVYEPYLEGTQDEKQYRVVKDRERWFNVVMGERMELDEASTDRLGERVALPLDLARSLALRLEI
jgi:hypothetical protein